MLIRTSAIAGSVRYSIADTPPRRVVESGETFIAFSLDNVRGGTHAALMLTPDEIDRLYAEKRKLGK